MSKKKKTTPEQRTFGLKQQLFAEELTVTDDLVQSVANNDHPVDQSDIDDINKVTEPSRDVKSICHSMVGL